MAIEDRDIIDIAAAPLSRGERLFLPSVFKGLGTTLRHCLGNLGRDGKNKKNLWVVQYPEEISPPSE